MSTTSATAPAATSMANSQNNASNGNGNSRTLLFFVALGFGVVFTNLWIIVGVKYCFRYNQRARQLAAMDADGVDGMDMNNVPRPRRRREKKLMTMDEVNTRFPLIKYKLWRASREQEGLPAAGGVTAPPSRTPSIKETMGLARTSTDLRHSLEEPVTHNDTAHHHTARNDITVTSSTSASRDFAATTPPTDGPSTAEHLEKGPDVRGATEMHNVEINEEDEDDPIRTAVPAELLAEPGDSCAICIDNLDDDDEVRGLTCGHAFHAACLDPWLTSRRACCPLCKADYYIPRPRPEGETGEHRHRGDRNTPIAMPGNVWIGGRGIYPRHRILIAGSHRFTVDNDRYGFPVLVRDTRNGQGQAQNAGEAVTGPGRMSRFRNAVFSSPSRGMPWLNVAMPRHQQAEPAQSEVPVTPGQLEAGQR